MRYTEKIDKTKEPKAPNDYIILGAFTNIPLYCKAADKFGRLEDSEEKIGIDLNILVRIITDDIYIKSGDVVTVTDRPPTFLFMDGEWLFELYVPEFMETVQCYFSDFGKTWALDKNGFKGE